MHVGVAHRVTYLVLKLFSMEKVVQSAFVKKIASGPKPSYFFLPHSERLGKSIMEKLVFRAERSHNLQSSNLLSPVLNSSEAHLLPCAVMPRSISTSQYDPDGALW